MKAIHKPLSDLFSWLELLKSSSSAVTQIICLLFSHLDNSILHLQTVRLATGGSLMPRIYQDQRLENVIIRISDEPVSDQVLTSCLWETLEALLTHAKPAETSS